MAIINRYLITFILFAVTILAHGQNNKYDFIKKIKIIPPSDSLSANGKIELALPKNETFKVLWFGMGISNKEGEILNNVKAGYYVVIITDSKGNKQGQKINVKCCR